MHITYIRYRYFQLKSIVIRSFLAAYQDFYNKNLLIRLFFIIPTNCMWIIKKYKQPEIVNHEQNYAENTQKFGGLTKFIKTKQGAECVARISYLFPNVN